jgi:hypothetical protein
MGGIRNAGHITGNHSFSHYDGFFTATGKYLDDVEKASGLTSSSLFRLPTDACDGNNTLISERNIQ